jgi:hypothetical protein
MRRILKVLALLLQEILRMLVVNTHKLKVFHHLPMALEL